ASGNVITGKIKKETQKAYFEFNGNMLDPMTGIVTTIPVSIKHSLQHEKLQQAGQIFETSDFNTHDGPENPELLIITSSICSLYAKEAVDVMNLDSKVAILKLGTTWPLPSKLIQKRIQKTRQILFVEEIQPFVEENIKVLSAQWPDTLGQKIFFGKHSNHIPMTGELNSNLVIKALELIFSIGHKSFSNSYKTLADKALENCAPAREISFCPGCPHRASFFIINKVLQLDNHNGFTCGDIGCYSLGILPGGFSTIKTLHAMGSGTGVASGFGKLSQFGMDQPIISVCGDSTFFHSGMPPLVNAVHNESNLTMIILDNSGTAMTGFQPHPGLSIGTRGKPAPEVDIEKVCKAMGAATRICDPFDLEKAENILLELMETKGVNVLILRQICTLSPEKKGKKYFHISIDKEKCKGEDCGCNRLCTRIFSCPGLIWNKEENKAMVNEIICTGCGFCTQICPVDAIKAEGL
ncbi:MAG: indolepyruvate ferredoxin oxidoreductase, partial [Desulfobacula sp.]|nr:indolepyruvate ferredoxin oxidoreductase [Desulfobacula sp.]